MLMWWLLIHWSVVHANGDVYENGGADVNDYDWKVEQPLDYLYSYYLNCIGKPMYSFDYCYYVHLGYLHRNFCWYPTDIATVSLCYDQMSGNFWAMLYRLDSIWTLIKLGADDSGMVVGSGIDANTMMNDSILKLQYSAGRNLRYLISYFVMMAMMMCLYKNFQIYILVWPECFGKHSMAMMMITYVLLTIYY